LIECSLGSAESFSIVQSRAAFMDVARQVGVRIPKTAIVETDEDVSRLADLIGLPAVLKADGTSGGDGIRIVRTVAEAKQAFRELQVPPLLARALKRAVLDHDSTLIKASLLRNGQTISAQSLIAGCEATSTVVCWKGTVLAALHFEVLRKSSSAGHATVVRLIENDEISTAVEKMVRRMGVSGLCGFDFMLEARTGHAYLIEMNPRATQVGHITLGPGRDLPAALYSAISEDPIRVTAPITENDTIALFPHEWARDPQSQFLRTAYHDVPWETPELVHACIRRSRKQSVWYSRADAKTETVVTLQGERPESSGARILAR
jgi:biotin carboxylase